MPNLFQFTQALGFTAGFFIIGKLFFMVVYEIRYGKGAGDDYLKFGKDYVKNNYKKIR